MSREEVMSALMSALPCDFVSDSGASRNLVAMLLDRGLIDYREVERMVARRMVESLCAEGMGRCDAMAEAAEKMCCSYEKIRAFIYQKREKNYAIRN
ncbi:MAG: hypothetical protein IJW42_06795 [Alistipes sp.]|nr:hypothetical protein [Alistipes sp.]MBQ7342948.1 hypothetical protein [Alistipes sp.]